MIVVMKMFLNGFVNSFVMKKIELTILSFGGGQDSTAILYKIIYDPAFRAKYVKGKLIVIMAETGNEHRLTYEHVKEIQQLCKEHNIEFYHLNYDYTPKSWNKGLIPFYRAGNRIGSKAFPKTCTDNLKIKPIYNFLEHYLHTTYDTKKFGRKKAMREFTKQHGRINVLIGIAHGEEKRSSTNEESPLAWMRDCINKIYPLIPEGMDRQACQDYIESVGHTIPIPSACVLCPFMNEQELLYLYRFDRRSFDEWVILEQNKIEANAYEGDITKTWSVKKGSVVDNLGVWGLKLLPEKIIEVIKKHGHMTDAELIEYRMSHGHCVKSKY